MENSSSSGEKFSFPTATIDPDQFEFGHVATNPVSCPDSPADHLFSNGKLLPHVFPIQPPTGFSYSRSTSRTSSGSKDYSLRSSRSNSRSSSSSSARTSTSEPSEIRRSLPIDGGGSPVARRERNKAIGSSDQYRRYQYGSSRRWQLIAAVPPFPVLKHQGSRSRSRSTATEILERKGSKKSRGIGEEERSWFGRRILKSFVLACKECHAI